jgi:RNA polymerase sigma factor (sigma-70 family)
VFEFVVSANSGSQFRRGLTMAGPDQDQETGLPSDADLARAAQAGDAASIGALLARHRARLLGVALTMLREPADAEDAVQESAVIALTRIGDLRDPSAVGPWLRAIVRNCCLMRLRAHPPLPTGDIEAMARPDASLDPARILEQHITSDWVLHAVEELSPPLRVVTLLRYFAGMTSSHDISTLCTIPAGTVRRRLAQARAKLAQSLLASASSVYPDVRGYATERHQEAEWTVDSLNRGEFGAVLRENWKPTVDSAIGNVAAMHGFAPLLQCANTDFESGVRQRLTDVIPSKDILIYRTDLISPPDDPDHCPPGATWLLSLDEGRVSRFRLFHAPRPAARLTARAAG